MVTFRWDVDDDGDVQYVSPNISVYGYTPEEFTSGRRTYASIVDRADIDWINEDGNDKSRAGLESWTQEYRIADAERRDALGPRLHHAVRGDDGAVTAYEGYIIDITRRRRRRRRCGSARSSCACCRSRTSLTGLYNRRGLFALGEHTHAHRAAARAAAWA